MSTVLPGTSYKTEILVNGLSNESRLTPTDHWHSAEFYTQMLEDLYYKASASVFLYMVVTLNPFPLNLGGGSLIFLKQFIFKMLYSVLCISCWTFHLICKVIPKTLRH